MTRRRRLLITGLVLLLAAALPWLLLAAVNLTLGAPPSGFDPADCTLFCHGNGGCRHSPLLPPFLTSDEGLYGTTIRALFRAGGGSFTGYGAANLVLFCVLWPGLMWVLLGVATWQRLELWARSQAARR